MSKALKVILYFLLGLVVLAVIAGVVFAIFGAFRFGMMRPGIRMMEPLRYSFSPFRMIFGGLFGLGVFILVIVGIVALVYALVRGNRPAQTPSSAPITTTAQVTAPTRTCSNCGKLAQEDWKTCPYCGNLLS